MRAKPSQFQSANWLLNLGWRDITIESKGAICSRRLLDGEEEFGRKIDLVGRGQLPAGQAAALIASPQDFMLSFATTALPGGAIGGGIVGTAPPDDT